MNKKFVVTDFFRIVRWRGQRRVFFRGTEKECLDWVEAQIQAFWDQYRESIYPDY